MIGKSLALARRHFSSGSGTQSLKRTHLYNFHKDSLKGKMVPFGGYEMPV